MFLTVSFGIIQSIAAAIFSFFFFFTFIFQFREMVSQLKDLVTEKQREISRAVAPYIQVSILQTTKNMPFYQSCIILFSIKSVLIVSLF